MSYCVRILSVVVRRIGTYGKSPDETLVSGVGSSVGFRGRAPMGIYESEAGVSVQAVP